MAKTVSWTRIKRKALLLKEKDNNNHPEYLPLSNFEVISSREEMMDKGVEMNRLLPAGLRSPIRTSPLLTQIPKTTWGPKVESQEELMMRVWISMSGPRIEIGQQEVVSDDYRTVAGRIRRKSPLCPSASRGKTPARTASRFLLTFVLVEI